MENKGSILILRSSSRNFPLDLESELKKAGYSVASLGDFDEFIACPDRYLPFLAMMEIGSTEDIDRAVNLFEWNELMQPLAAVRYMLLMASAKISLGAHAQRLASAKVVVLPQAIRGLLFKFELQMQLVRGSQRSSFTRGEGFSAREEEVPLEAREEEEAGSRKRILVMRGQTEKDGKWQGVGNSPTGKIRWRWVRRPGKEGSAASAPYTWFADSWKEPQFDPNLQAWPLIGEDDDLVCVYEGKELYSARRTIESLKKKSVMALKQEKNLRSAEAGIAPMAGNAARVEEKFAGQLKKSSHSAAEEKIPEIIRGPVLSGASPEKREPEVLVGKSEESQAAIIEEISILGRLQKPVAAGNKKTALRETNPPAAWNQIDPRINPEESGPLREEEIRPETGVAPLAEDHPLVAKEPDEKMPVQTQMERGAIFSNSEGYSEEHNRLPAAPKGALYESPAIAEKTAPKTVSRKQSSGALLVEAFAALQKAQQETAKKNQLAGCAENIPTPVAAPVVELAGAQGGGDAARTARQFVLEGESAALSQPLLAAEVSGTASGSFAAFPAEGSPEPAPRVPAQTRPDAASVEPAVSHSALLPESNAPEPGAVSPKAAKKKAAEQLSSAESFQPAAAAMIELNSPPQKGNDRHALASRFFLLMTLKELNDQESSWHPTGRYRIYLSAHHRYFGLKDPSDVLALWIYDGELAPEFIDESQSWKFYDRLPVIVTVLDALPEEVLEYLKVLCGLLPKTEKNKTKSFPEITEWEKAHPMKREDGEEEAASRGSEYYKQKAAKKLSPWAKLIAIVRSAIGL